MKLAEIAQRGITRPGDFIVVKRRVVKMWRPDKKNHLYKRRGVSSDEMVGPFLADQLKRVGR